jgi:hypothetical protein
MDEYYRYDMKADEIKNLIAESEAKGKMEGLAEGEVKGKVEAMRNMVIKLHQQGANRDLMVNVTGLSLKEIERIIKEDSKN